jgi:hypothetical protein
MRFRAQSFWALFGRGLAGLNSAERENCAEGLKRVTLHAPVNNDLISMPGNI